MEENKDSGFFMRLIADLQNYTDTNVRLVYLSGVEKVSVILSRFVTSFLFASILLLLFFFVSISLGFYLSDYFGKLYVGFGLVSLFYLLLFMLLYFTRNRFLKKKLTDFFIRTLLKDKDA